MFIVQLPVLEAIDDLLTSLAGIVGSIHEELHDALCIVQEYYPHVGFGRI